MEDNLAEVKEEVVEENDGNNEHCNDPDRITSICDAKFSPVHGEILYRVCWYQENVLRKTWETETRMEALAKDPMLALLLQAFQFREQNLLETMMQKKTEFQKNKSGRGWVYEETNCKENEPPIFYGSNTNQLDGEAARLFDSSHKFTETEKALAMLNTNPGKRLTRSQLSAVWINDRNDGSASSSSITTPTLGATKTPPARRERGRVRDRKSAGTSRAKKGNADNTSTQAVLDEPIVQHVSSESSDLLTAEMSNTQKTKQKTKKRPIVEEEDGDADTRTTHETVTQEEELQQNSTIPTLDLLGCLKLDPNTLPSASISATVPERKKRTIVGRRVLPLENIGITAEMMEQASKPIDEIQQLVERKALEESADQVERIARSLQSNCVQEAFTKAILEGKVDHARGLAKFHVLCPISSNFNIQATDEITGQNLLHKVCQVSCNDAKVRDPDYMHALCDATEYLIQSGLDPRQVDLSDKTALQYAVEKKLFCRVRRLLSLRAPVNFQGIELKDSLLYQAYTSNHRSIFKLLLDNGANFSQLEKMIAIGRIPHNRVLNEVLKTHSNALKQRFNEAKRKVLIDIEEVHPVSSMYVANFYEGPTFWFDFHYHAENIPTADYFFVLFVATAVVDESNKWHMALWGDSPLKTEPVLNEEEMIPIQYIEQYGPMNTSSKKSAIFLGTPLVGANRFHVTLNKSKSPPPLGDGNAYTMCHNWKIVLQMSLLKKSKQKVTLKASTSTQPILEHAPDAPSSYY
ncbi:unnamed protein product, partial [Mesorhabditis belari]|uniref:Uncharacterized protein n=1 Tax=Mesorhabditis belari TaxID=2138241 RepID=A0AAF3ET12_9BILA